MVDGIIGRIGSLMRPAAINELQPPPLLLPKAAARPAAGEAS
jgi:hypothetical protein